MITLAIDTCLDACSVALFDNEAGGVISGRHESMSRGHAEALLPLIDEVFKETALRPDQLDQIIVTRGPGTFTGVRIGLSAARGLAISSRVLVGALSSLRTIALCTIETEHPETPVVAAIDARRDELYIAGYSRNGEEVMAPVIVPVSGDAPLPPGFPIGDVLVSGSGAAILAGRDERFRVSLSQAVPDARIWGPRAVKMPQQLQDPTPLYLRRPDAKPPSPDAQVRLAAT